MSATDETATDSPVAGTSALIATLVGGFELLAQSVRFVTVVSLALAVSAGLGLALHLTAQRLQEQLRENRHSRHALLQRHQQALRSLNRQTGSRPNRPAESRP